MTRATVAGNPTLQEALRLRDAGISVIPIGDNKLPAGWALPRHPDDETKGTWDPYKERLPTRDEVIRWFGGARRKHGIARVHGAVSGNLETLDFDVDPELTGLEHDAVVAEWEGLVEELRPGLLFRPTKIRTPRPGTHFTYRCEEPVEGNQKIAHAAELDLETRQPARLTNGGLKWKAFIETRGEGGYAVGPGTPANLHPQNREYEHVAGPPLHEVQTITAEERLILLNAARMLSRKQEADPEPEPYQWQQSNGAADRPGDDFNARTTWDEILRERGWTKVSQGGGGAKWKRPGGTSQWSATTNYGGHDLLHVFSTGLPIPADRSYSRFQFVTYMDHGGDFSAATRALATKGYGKQPKRKTHSPSSDRSERPAEEPNNIAARVEIVSITDMVARFPRLRPVVIDGLLRKGETANIIAPSKFGKSWLSYSLALSVATGGRWLDTFACPKGCVLLLDNELHQETISARIPAVADAMGLPLKDCGGGLDIVSLRGRLLDLVQLRGIIDRIERGQYALIIADAWYRFMPEGMSENDNSHVMKLYNVLDQYTAATDAGWVNIHHTSKGLQSEKSVTDVGSGAGSQSRAADSHIVLRHHEEEGVVVFDAALRSFPPVEPFSLRWEFPLWVPDGTADPSMLKGRKSKFQEEQDRRDSHTDTKILKHLDTWRSVTELRKKTGFGDNRIIRAVVRLEEAGFVESNTARRRGNECNIYRKTLRAN